VSGTTPRAAPAARDTTGTGAAPSIDVALLVGALAILVSGWVHFFLYFRGGYRGISPEDVAGLTISRAFALDAIAAVVIAEALVLSIQLEGLRLPAALAGLGASAATIVAFVLSRTVGLLGFEETAATTESVVALAAETIAILALTPVLWVTWRHRGRRRGVARL
jgi:hypothetical protein